MYKHILIATDGSELAQKAVAHGLALAKALGSRATAITVTEPWTAVVSGEVALTVPVEEYEQGAAADAQRILAGVTAASAKAGIACAVEHVKDRYPAEAIVDTAETKGCDLIVMASHGRRGITRLLLGSQANQVVTHSSVPVLICR